MSAKPLKSLAQIRTFGLNLRNRNGDKPAFELNPGNLEASIMWNSCILHLCMAVSCIGTPNVQDTSEVGRYLFDWTSLGFVNGSITFIETRHKIVFVQIFLGEAIGCPMRKTACIIRGSCAVII